MYNTNTAHSLSGKTGLPEIGKKRKEKELMKKDKKNPAVFVPDNTTALILKGYWSEKYSSAIMKLGMKQ